MRTRCQGWLDPLDPLDKARLDPLDPLDKAREEYYIQGPVGPVANFEFGFGFGASEFTLSILSMFFNNFYVF